MNISDAIPILYFHSVADRCLSVKPSVFRAQMAYLRKRGYRVVGVGEMVTSLAAGEHCGKTVALSFDDGFAGVCDHALPVLQEFRFRATCFVVPGYAGTTLWGDSETRTWSETDRPGLVPFPMMSWAQIRQWNEADMEVGSHTLSHRNLTELAEAEAQREISESKQYLEEKLGVPIRGFCYPRGRVTDTLARFVEEVGYDYACTTQPCRATAQSDPFLLPRIPGPASMSDFVFHLKRFPSNLFTKGVLKIARNLEKLESAIRGTAEQSHRQA